MSKTSSCRICGKSFVPCGKSSKDIGSFNYREVACSPECGQVYLTKVTDGRKKNDKNDDVKQAIGRRKSKPTYIDNTTERNIKVAENIDLDSVSEE